jgi:CheY-like chemotaxis protein
VLRAITCIKMRLFRNQQRGVRGRPGYPVLARRARREHAGSTLIKTMVTLALVTLLIVCAFQALLSMDIYAHRQADVFGYEVAALWGLILLTAVLVLRKLVPRIVRWLDAASQPCVSLPAGAAEILAEEKSFSAFASSLWLGPRQDRSQNRPTDRPYGKSSSTGSDKSLTPFERGPVDETPLNEFFATATKIIARMNQVLEEVVAAPDQSARQKLLSDLARETQELKNKAGILDLIPIWRLGAALEGFLNQITDDENKASASALHTVATALALLDKLCVARLAADSLTRNPPRILVVDDDAVTRHALVSTLKKAVGVPDVAFESKSAMDWIETKPYDVIFLDVEMPGMDGFEVCAQIRTCAENRTTPVVFVTSHHDFKSRAKSIQSGGHDLIAKPFLTFELTLKALTLILRSRLGYSDAHTFKPSPPPLLRAIAESVIPQIPAPAQVPRSPKIDDQKILIGLKNETITLTKDAGKTSTVAGTNFAQTFFSRAPARLKSMAEALATLKNAAEPMRVDILNELYIETDSLPNGAGMGNSFAIFRLSSALKNLFTKLIESPSRLSESVLETARLAVGILQEMCDANNNPDLSAPPVRILLVDDEPVGRRAIAGTLQMQFGKPDTADSGYAALGLAEGQRFDVIFMDVFMPGMDGFECCAKIRDTELNRDTPVIFVTSHADQRTEEKAAQAGGNGFISKGFLPAEIILTSLAFAVRSRLRRDPESALATA